jgi:hypothetical protein
MIHCFLCSRDGQTSAHYSSVKFNRSKPVQYLELQWLFLIQRCSFYHFVRLCCSPPVPPRIWSIHFLPCVNHFTVWCISCSVHVLYFTCYLLHCSLCSHFTESEPPVGARGSVVVKVLCYKPEGRRFETRWGEWFLSNVIFLHPVAHNIVRSFSSV